MDLSKIVESIKYISDFCKISEKCDNCAISIENYGCVMIDSAPCDWEVNKLEELNCAEKQEKDEIGKLIAELHQKQHQAEVLTGEIEKLLVESRNKPGKA